MSAGFRGRTVNTNKNKIHPEDTPNAVPLRWSLRTCEGSADRITRKTSNRPQSHKQWSEVVGYQLTVPFYTLARMVQSRD